MKVNNVNGNPLKNNPSLIFIIGFIGVVFIGTTLLNFPFSSLNGRSIGFTDALFTATSAVCVTGLTVVTTATQWTIIGKIIILCLIQIGGLGVMTLSTLIAFFLGKKISLKTRLLIKEERNTYELQGVVRVTKNVLIYTFIVEFIGAILFSFVFCKEYGFIKGIWFSIFHSISSFCNAGFDIVGNTSFMKYVTNPLINFTTIILIVVGGLGFFVFIEIIKVRKFKKFSLHSKIVLIMTGILLLSGTILIMVLEYNNANTIGNLGFFGKLQASLFQSVATRTAGYSTIDISGLKDSTSVIMCILMFIGGSSGSTAGGVKVTTIAVAILAMHSTIYGKKHIDIFQKRISNSVIMKAIAVIGIAFGVVTVVSIILSITQHIPAMSYVDVLFESVSAFGTVGLTRNVTPYLNFIGKILISGTMFIGRLGPLTIALAVASRQNRFVGNIGYPEGKIIIG
ncbi:Trk family potassium uptake protein [Sedimentibacter sp. zth1]|uniref:TrkH family potassium uptake protein n=1 Tax=Sedimentibacter sp. zth1 TaxID=2816908 RepID=UPI001A90F706|nr:TrkH family potassium uptake protein [Sedimentibacter sp. zth1]QSX06138.1 Trk family potassium uptake protein [Sedimentibacter sp. zth1]